MPKQKLDNPVLIEDLEVEPPARTEIEGLIHSGETRLRDAENENRRYERFFHVDSSRA